MSLENSNKKPTTDVEESFLVDQQLQLTVEDDFSYFCKFDDLAMIIDSQIPKPNNKSNLNENQEPSEEKGSQLVDCFEVEDDFSYFCMYDDLMGIHNKPTNQEEDDDEQSLDVSNTNVSPPIWCQLNMTEDEYNKASKNLINGLIKMEIDRKLRLYFLGEITPNKLLEDTDKEGTYYIYSSINNILNYRYKGTRYYIGLPQDMFFNTKECANSSFILACKSNENFKELEMIKIIGPTNFKYSSHVLERYIEIDGDFSQIPSGAKLTTYDYLQIMKKHPNILEHIIQLLKTDYKFSHCYVNKSEVEMQQLALEHLQRWLGWNPKPNEDTSKSEENPRGETVLSQETIDSITFVQPIEYLTIEEVKNGTFGTFEELLVRINHSQSTPIQTGETPKVLKLTTPKNTDNK